MKSLSETKNILSRPQSGLDIPDESDFPTYIFDDDAEIFPDYSVKAIEISTESIKLAWDPPVLKDTTYSVSSYRIAARRLGLDPTGFVPIILDTKSEKPVVAIVDLQPGTAYQFQIVALTWRGYMVPGSSIYSPKYSTHEKDYDFAWFFEREHDATDVWRSYMDTPVGLLSSQAQLPVTGNGVFEVKLSVAKYYAGVHSLSINKPADVEGGVYTDVTVEPDTVCMVRARVCHQFPGPGCKLVIWQFFEAPIESECATNEAQNMWELLQVQFTSRREGRFRIAIHIPPKYEGHLYLDAVDVKSDETPEDRQAKHLEQLINESTNPQSKRMSVEVVSARNVQIPGKLQLLSPFCVLRWGGQEIGRTPSKLDYRWEKNFTFERSIKPTDTAVKRKQPRGGPRLRSNIGKVQRGSLSEDPVNSKVRPATEKGLLINRGATAQELFFKPSTPAPVTRRKHAKTAPPRILHTPGSPDLHRTNILNQPPAATLRKNQLPRPVFGNLPDTVFNQTGVQPFKDVGVCSSVASILQCSIGEEPEDIYPFLSEIAGNVMKRMNKPASNSQDRLVTSSNGRRGVQLSQSSFPNSRKSSTGVTDPPKEKRSSFAKDNVSAVDMPGKEVAVILKDEIIATNDPGNVMKSMNKPASTSQDRLLSSARGRRSVQLSRSSLPIGRKSSTGITDSPKEKTGSFSEDNVSTIDISEKDVPVISDDQAVAINDAEVENQSLVLVAGFENSSRHSSTNLFTFETSDTRLENESCESSRSSMNTSFLSARSFFGDTAASPFKDIEKGNVLAPIIESQQSIASKTQVEDFQTVFSGPARNSDTTNMSSTDNPDSKEETRQKHRFKLELMEKGTLRETKAHAYMSITEENLFTSKLGCRWYRLKSKTDKTWCGDISLVIRNYDAAVTRAGAEYGFLCRQMVHGSSSQKASALKELCVLLEQETSSVFASLKIRSDMVKCSVLDEVVAQLHVARHCAEAIRALRLLTSVPEGYLNRKRHGMALKRKLLGYCIFRGATDVLADNLCVPGKFPTQLILDFLADVFTTNSRALVQTVEKRALMFDAIVKVVETPGGSTLMRLIGQEDELPLKVVRMFERQRLNIPLKEGFWRSAALQKMRPVYVPDPEDGEGMQVIINRPYQKFFVGFTKTVAAIVPTVVVTVLPIVLLAHSHAISKKTCKYPIKPLVIANNVFVIGFWLFCLYMKSVLKKLYGGEGQAEEHQHATFHLWCCLACVCVTVHFTMYFSIIYFAFSAKSLFCNSEVISLGQQCVVFLGALKALLLFVACVMTIYNLLNKKQQAADDKTIKKK